MKRTILLLTILALFAGLSASAQFSLVRSLGIEGGLSIASQNWKYDPDIDQDIKSRTGVNVLLQLEGIQIPYLSLIAEVGYIEKGSIMEVENTTVDMPEGDGTYRDVKHRFEYFTASPMLKIRKEFMNLAPYVVVGPRLDIQLGYTSDADWSTVKDNFNKTVFGLNYGLGVEYKLSKLGFSLSARHQPDFGSMYEYSQTSGINSLEIKNKVVLVNAGLKYFFD